MIAHAEEPYKEDEILPPKKVFTLEERIAMAREALAVYVKIGGSEVDEARVNIRRFFKLSVCSDIG
jgi:hypothetical protein